MTNEELLNKAVELHIPVYRYKDIPLVTNITGMVIFNNDEYRLWIYYREWVKLAIAETEEYLLKYEEQRNYAKERMLSARYKTTNGDEIIISKHEDGIGISIKEEFRITTASSDVTEVPKKHTYIKISIQEAQWFIHYLKNLIE